MEKQEVKNFEIAPLKENWYLSSILIFTVLSLVLSYWWIAASAFSTCAMMQMMYATGRAKRLKLRVHELYQGLAMTLMVVALVVSCVAAVLTEGTMLKVVAMVPFIGTFVVANKSKKK
jgi:hypothetical protein